MKMSPAKIIAAGCAAALLAATALAQGTAPANRAPAVIAGVVTRDPDGEPVKKALIELIAENQAVGGNYTAVTGFDGTFRIENILPGRYHLFAERTGMLDIDKNRGRSDGRTLALASGEEVKDLHIRVQAAAVVHGRVTDEDGDAMPNAEVTVLRQTFAAGHKHWDQVGAERTNDLGEYRVANLPAGNVYVSVSPPPDFKSLIESGNGEHAAPAGAEKPASPVYQTTYYPGTSDRSQAAPIQLRPGDEFPVNFSLTPSPALTIRGSVTNLPPRTLATIMLQSRDFRLVFNGAEMHKDGTFVIRDVSPGSYSIIASVDGTAVPMTARLPLQVGSSNVEGIVLSPVAGTVVRGRLRVDAKNGLGQFDPDRTFLLLQSSDSDDDDSPNDRFSNLAHVAADGSFEWRDVPAGTYYIQPVRDAGPDSEWFVKSVLAGGRDLNDAGISVAGGSVSLDLVVSANGAVVEGIATNHAGDPVSNAVVVLVPEPRLRGHVDRYRKSVSDQNGHFTVGGIPPGDYTLLAWESVEGEAYYNPDFIKIYEPQGTAFHLAEGDHKPAQIEVISPAEP